MKVFVNGLNIYSNLAIDYYKIEEFTELPCENLLDLEMTYTFIVKLIDNELQFSNKEIGTIEIYKGENIKQFSCCENKILILLKDNTLLKYFINNLSIERVSIVLNSDDEIIQISCGSHLNVALSKKGHIYNLPTKLDYINPNIIDIKTGKEHCLLLDRNGNVYSFGCGSRGQLGHGFLDDEVEPKLIEALGGIQIQAISVGGWHSCALSKDGDIYCWGWNGTKQLGINLVSVMATPTVIDFPNIDVNVRRIACGARHTIALLDNNQLWGCGWNKYNQLKKGDEETFDKMTFLYDFSNYNIDQLKCGPWNSIVFCK